MKRYTTRLKIIADIDKAIKKIKRTEEVVQEHLDQEEFLTGIDAQLSQLRHHRELADKGLRKIKRLRERRLAHLKAKLSEFDTALLPGVNELLEIFSDKTHPTAPPAPPLSVGASCGEHS